MPRDGAFSKRVVLYFFWAVSSLYISRRPLPLEEMGWACVSRSCWILRNST
jgi:hypothetical protein